MTSEERKPRNQHDLAALTGIGERSCRRHIEKGDMPGYKIGERYWVPDEQYDLFARGLWRPASKANVTALDLIKQRRTA